MGIGSLHLNKVARFSHEATRGLNGNMSLVSTYICNNKAVMTVFHSTIHTLIFKSVYFMVSNTW